jgi:hypothetical protein
MDNIDLFFDLIDENTERYDLFWRHEANMDRESMKIWSSGKLIVSESVDNDSSSHERLFYLAAKDLDEWLRQQA